jgi:hypothetical protein
MKKPIITNISKYTLHQIVYIGFCIMKRVAKRAFGSCNTIRVENCTIESGSSVLFLLSIHLFLIFLLVAPLFVHVFHSCSGVGGLGGILSSTCFLVLHHKHNIFMKGHASHQPTSQPAASQPASQPPAGAPASQPPANH